MTEEQLNKFFDGITSHNKEMLDREKDANKKTDEFLGLCEKSILPHMKIKMYPEDSEFNNCGSKVDSDIFFKKLNESEIEPELVEYLKEYLTEEELKDRFTEDNFMTNVKVPELIKTWQIIKKLKKIEKKIEKNKKEFEFVKEAFEKYKNNEKAPEYYSTNNVQDLLDLGRERDLCNYDWDKFLTKE